MEKFGKGDAFTAIRVQLPETSEVRLSVYNLLGQEVRILLDGKVEAGWYSALWDGRDASGRDAASGMYLCRLHAGDFVRTRRIVLLR
ncbi:MAG: T9SS type A sorting domain-containing protein [Candidatus Latescibacteria bacterium]|nr:T9SS type A sorting domain-containing protein [Candidatus Latescibacterota bacterium]